MPPSTAPVVVRPIQACQRCRNYKVGCDKTRPHCRRCVRSHSECVYFGPDAMPSASSFTVLGREDASLAHQQWSLHKPSRLLMSGLTPPDTEVSLLAPSSRCTSPAETTSSSKLQEGPYPCSASNFRSAQLIPAKSHARQAGKRDRAILSCIRCRKHKIRCDRRTPCGRCMKNNKDSECIYPDALNTDAVPTEKPYKSLHGIATSFIDHRWDDRFRNVTHWTGLLREVYASVPTSKTPWLTTFNRLDCTSHST